MSYPVFKIWCNFRNENFKKFPYPLDFARSAKLGPPQRFLPSYGTVIEAPGDILCPVSVVIWPSPQAFHSVIQRENLHDRQWVTELCWSNSPLSSHGHRRLQVRLPQRTEAGAATGQDSQFVDCPSSLSRQLKSDIYVGHWLTRSSFAL